MYQSIHLHNVMTKRKREKSLTIQDIADRLGVSKMTVSNALRGRSSEVSVELIERIREEVRKSGYVKNLTAATLAGVQSQTIALIAMGVYEPHKGNPDPQISPFYGELTYRLERFARDAGFALLVYTGWENEYISFLVQRRVDAAVLIGVAPNHIPRPHQRGNAKLIMVDAKSVDPTLMHVRSDDRLGGRLSAERLITRGCRNLAFVGDFGEYQPNPTTADRYAGARVACRKAGVQLHRAQCWHAIGFGAEAAPRLAALGVDGVVTAADVVAAGLINGFRALGRRVPQDVAVMGYDNLPVAELTHPPLSTVDIVLNEKVRAILDLIERGRPGDRRIVKPKLVVRQSA